MSKVIISTSWDDGSILDLKLISLLEKYNIKGTFYCCKSTKNRLNDTTIRDISKNYEIGAHTLNHLNLTEISIDKAIDEIQGSKKWLEDVIGKRVNMFCYPYGFYNNRVKKLVEDSGFIGARITENFCFDLGNDPFSIPVTLQVFPFPVFPSKNHGNKFLIYRNWAYFKNIKRLRLSLSSFISWSKLAMAAFERVKKYQGIWHIWGHSDEIERYCMWEELEKVFKYVSDRSNCEYFSNGYLAKKLTEEEIR